MSVYTELLRLGIDDEAARTIADTVRIAQDYELVTKQHLDLRLAEFEARLAWKIGAINAGSMAALTAIFALVAGWLR